MDLIRYYAQYGPKSTRSEGAASQKNPTAKDSATTSLARSARLKPNPTELSVDSDIEEDDTKEIPLEELRGVLLQLRSNAPALRTQVEQFNKTHTAIDTPVLTRPRPRPPKRVAPSGPPRADRKRRKLVPELKPEPEPEPEPKQEPKHEPGPEIPPALAPVSEPMLSVHEKQPAPSRSKQRVSAVRITPGTLFSARVSTTEERLNALETRLQTLEETCVTREHVASAVDRAIGELEGSGVRSTADRLRALRSSILREDDPVTGGWGPSIGMLVEGEQDGFRKLGVLYEEHDGASRHFEVETMLAGDRETVLESDNEGALLENGLAVINGTMDSENMGAGGSKTAQEDGSENTILKNGVASMDAISI
ncbi:hypothetical protein DFH07DRAFT_961244 [Mycena maculata]|uniref:Uncharacterized protein n=1 Tax=Mycena maculata TaxID=230809 RepID=A0AAD7IWX9_9AGAR|nr:hypothetical protein DFH07DRAFT_961244 [Mycena maculata]